MTTSPRPIIGDEGEEAREEPLPAPIAELARISLEEAVVPMIEAKETSPKKVPVGEEIDRVSITAEETVE